MQLKFDFEAVQSLEVLDVVVALLEHRLMCPVSKTHEAQNVVG